MTFKTASNVLLDRIDHLIKDRLRVKRYLRYVDDLALCHNDKVFLLDVRAHVQNELHNMKLELNEGKSRIRLIKEGIGFLGFVVRPNHILYRRGRNILTGSRYAGVRVGAKTIQRHRIRCKRMCRSFQQSKSVLGDIEASITAYKAHISYADSYRLRVRNHEIEKLSGSLRSKVD